MSDENNTKREEEMCLLRSMYAEGSELVVSKALDSTEQEGLGLEFTLNLESSSGPVSMVFRLPSTYPRLSSVSVFVRLPFPAFSNLGAAAFNAELREYIACELGFGEPQVLPIVSWVLSAIPEKAEEPSTSGTIERVVEAPAVLCRLWVHSHHIYSAMKRKDIVGLAKDFNVTGWSLPGKPGLICAEGLSADVDAYWAAIKAWNWHRISVRLRDEETTTTMLLDSRRKFQGFRELVTNETGGRDTRMDLGDLRHFLNDHGCAHAFPILLRLE